MSQENRENRENHETQEGVSLIPMKQKDVKPLREELLKKNNYRCKCTGLPLKPEDAALDHAHQDSEFSETVEGQIRGTIHKFVNSLEGSWRSKYVRSGLSKMITFEELLLHMHTYLMESRELYTHPSHNNKPRKLMKSSYNELCREIKKYNSYAKSPIKVPDYPKSKKLTKRLSELFMIVGLQPKYYGAT